jgi:hypothetical protein
MQKLIRQAKRAYPKMFYTYKTIFSYTKQLFLLCNNQMTLQPCGIEKSYMAVSHGQSLYHTGENVRIDSPHPLVCRTR